MEISKESLIDIYRDAVDILEGQGYDADLREDYSGRGMYGKETAGIVTDASGPMVGLAVAIALKDRGYSLASNADFVPTSVDSIGLSTIFYHATTEHY